MPSKRLKTLIAVIFLLVIYKSESLTDNLIMIDSTDFIKNASLNIANEPASAAAGDTTEKSSSQQETLSKYVSPDDFTIAGSPRYTMDATLPLKETKIKPIPAALMGALYTGIFIAQHEAQANTIWKEKRSFRFAEDAQYTAYLDKAGHFYGTFMPAYILNESLLMSGFSYDASAILASSMGLAYTTYVEIADGYGKDFGFSPSDFYADVAGATFFLAQHYVPFLQNFTPKFQYVKPSWHGEQDRFPHDAFIDDYSSQVFWMSAHVHNLLPEGLKDYWPKWIDLSFGYAVYSLCDELKANEARQNDPNFCYECNAPSIGAGQRGNKKFIVALDYNLIELLPDGPGFWKWFRQGLNYFKLPSPAVEFGKVTKFYLMYPIDIKVGNVRL